MYAVLKPKRDWNTIGDQFKSHAGFKLPTSCRVTHINIQTDFNLMDLNCCQNLNIFNDINATNTASTNAKTETNAEKCQIECNNFYECKIPVKGFKDQLIKGQSIWMNNVSV